MMTSNVSDLVAETAFLLERLISWSEEGLNDENARDWYGHVEPAIARTKSVMDALEIRSADDVRREALEEAAERLKHEKKIAPNLGYYDAVDWILSLIDTPQTKGGDDE